MAQRADDALGSDLVRILELSGGQGLRVVGLGLMFLTLLTSPPKLAVRPLEAPLIVWFGRRSYSIYLWHLGINAYCLISFRNSVSSGSRSSARSQREHRGNLFSLARTPLRSE